jgi:RNA polymerase sigma factor (sigma-70 family)
VFSQIPEAESLFATLLGPESNFDEQVLREKIKKTFTMLTPRYSLILKLKYVYGYSVSEISQKLSISFKSAESQLFRARRAFVLAYNI